MLLTWETQASDWTIEAIGPMLPESQAGLPLVAIAAHPHGQATPVVQPLVPSHGAERWSLIRTVGGDPRTPAVTVEEAEAAALEGEGLAVLVDWMERKVRVLPGRARKVPTILVRTGEGRLRLISDFGALHRHAGGRVSSAGVNFFLGFGHAPPHALMRDDMWQLRPGRVATLTGGPQELNIAFDPAPVMPRGVSSAPMIGHDAVMERLATCLTGHVTGLVIGVVHGGTDLAAERLAQLAAESGAALVLPIRALDLPDSLSPPQSALIALSGEPQADPVLVATAAAAAADQRCDVLLLDWGAEALLMTRPHYRNFADAVQAVGLSGAPRNLLGGFLCQGVFARDLLYDLIGLFSDEERFRIIGPALAGEGFIAMADDLGLALEGTTDEAAVAAAAEADLAMRLQAAAALLPAVQAMVRRPVLAPFLDPGVGTSLRATGTSQIARASALGGITAPSVELTLRPADIAADRLPAMLGPQARIFSTGLLARTPPLVALLARDQPRTQRQMRQAFALLALEKWLRILSAGV